MFNSIKTGDSPNTHKQYPDIGARDVNIKVFQGEESKNAGINKKQEIQDEVSYRDAGPLFPQQLTQDIIIEKGFPNIGDEYPENGNDQGQEHQHDHDGNNEKPMVQCRLLFSRQGFPCAFHLKLRPVIRLSSIGLHTDDAYVKWVGRSRDGDGTIRRSSRWKSWNNIERACSLLAKSSQDISQKGK